MFPMERPSSGSMNVFYEFIQNYLILTKDTEPLLQSLYSLIFTIELQQS